MDIRDMISFEEFYENMVQIMCGDISDPEEIKRARDVIESSDEVQDYIKKSYEEAVKGFKELLDDGFDPVDFARYVDDTVRSAMAIEGLDPDDPVKFAEYKGYFDNPRGRKFLFEQYQDHKALEKRVEEHRERIRQFNDKWLHEYRNENYLSRLKLIYMSMMSIFKGWNDRIERTRPYDSPVPVNAAQVFYEDFIVICMKIAAADKEIEECEAGWLNSITGDNKTPADYYKIYRDSSSVSEGGKLIHLNSLLIASLIDRHEGERGSAVNADNVIKLFVQAAKSIAAMDGEIESEEHIECDKLEEALHEFHKKFRRSDYTGSDIRYKVPEGYTGSIRL
ncbi:MAG: hypothetical protein K6G58_03145 [Lachnospiraceae bacterium]|nr:hypothetical protein [Lachnospiraceae bacterium]